jgi:membrane protein implicated in regulation of membrane protease activity
LIAEKPKVVAAMMLAVILGVGTAEILIFKHPFGYIISVTLAVLIAGLVLVTLRRIVKKRFRDSAEYHKAMDELTDHILKATDDPNEPARFVP